MPIAILEVSTFTDIPKFVPFGVLYYTQDTSDLYIGTGDSVGPAVTFIGTSGASDTCLAVSTSQSLPPVDGNLYVDATAGASGIALTLPTAVVPKGRRICILMVDAGAGGVTINTTNVQAINGGSSYVLTNQWQTVTLESNGANWRVVAAAG